MNPFSLEKSMRPSRRRHHRHYPGMIVLAILALAGLPGSLSGQCTRDCGFSNFCRLSPSALAVDPSPTGDSDANGVIEPGEKVVVRPFWTKFRTYGPSGSLLCSTQQATGKATTLTGPPSGDYRIGDDSARYFLPAGSTGEGHCRSECYEMSVAVPAERPVAHWDAHFNETVQGGLATKTWTLHVGDSFSDVPRSNPFYLKIETLLHRGITSGCSPSEFCPDQNLTRGQIATFVAKGLAGTEANIPVSGMVGTQPYDCTAGGVSLFADVAPTDLFCRHIHYLATFNVSPRCVPGLFCPGDVVTRLEMAAFVANALLFPGGHAVPLTYGPDPTTGLSYNCDPANPNVHFNDVPDSNHSCKDANYLWARGIIAGCSPTEFCPSGEITRAQMAKFLVNAFHLTLYGTN